MPSHLSQTTKKAVNLFFVLFLTIGSLIAGSAALLYRAELNTFLSEIKTQERNALSRKNDGIKQKFDAIVGDLIFLSRQNELLDYIQSNHPGIRQAVQREYMELARAKRIYDQIRYLDAQGMEQVRVNLNTSGPGPVPREKMQSKARRYYFEDTIVLDKGEIFVSPLDLNVEQGQVELPLKPMIRFGTPVFDAQGEKHGIILINYLARDLLNFIEVRQDGKKSETLLLNAQGYWLRHPVKEKEWGFMFKDRNQSAFAIERPREWQMMREQKTGQFQTPNGLFTFTTIYPLQEGYRSSSGSGAPYTPSVTDLDPSGYFWILVSHIDTPIMKTYTRALLARVFTIGAGLFVLISLGSWQLAMAITKRRIYQAQLIELAHYDALTGLPNRKLFFDRLESELAHAQRHKRRLGLLYIDLDGFKKVNDTMGHDAGDALLVQVGAALKKNIRKADTVGRLGGDEFAVILSEISAPEDARQVGEKIVAAMNRPFELASGTARIGASVGATIFPDHENTMAPLIKRADRAMYMAKAKGKNTCTMASDEG